MWWRIFQPKQTQSPSSVGKCSSSKEQKGIRVPCTKTMTVTRWGGSSGCEGTGVHGKDGVDPKGILKAFKQRNTTIRIMLFRSFWLQCSTSSVAYPWASYFISLSFICRILWDTDNSTRLAGCVGSEWDNAYNIHGTSSHTKQFLGKCWSFPSPLWATDF